MSAQPADELDIETIPDLGPAPNQELQTVQEDLELTVAVEAAGVDEPEATIAGSSAPGALSHRAAILRRSIRVRQPWEVGPVVPVRDHPHLAGSPRVALGIGLLHSLSREDQQIRPGHDLAFHLPLLAGVQPTGRSGEGVADPGVAEVGDPGQAGSGRDPAGDQVARNGT